MTEGATMTEWDVIELFEDRFAVGVSRSHTLRGACGALADWVAREWAKLSPDDRDELITLGAVLLFVQRKYERNDYQ
jgi:hypothetical protein